MYDQKYTSFNLDMYVNKKLLTNLFTKCQQIQFSSDCASDQVKAINLKFNLKLVA